MKLNSDLSKLESLVLFCIDNSISLFPFITGDEVNIYEGKPYDAYIELIKKKYIDEEEQIIIKKYYTQSKSQDNIDNSSDKEINKLTEELRVKFSVDNIQVASRMQDSKVVSLALTKFFEKYPSVTYTEVVDATDNMIGYYKATGNNETIPGMVKYIIGTTDTNSLFYWIQELRIKKNKKIDNKLL